MRLLLFVFLILSITCLPGFTATITVAQDGSGDVNTIQNAVAMAAEGDDILVLDSAVYDEDLAAGPLAGFAAQFTLKAAEGQSPTLRAVNSAERLGAIGAPGADLLGAFFAGCVGVVIEGMTFENPTTDINVLTISAAIALMDCNDVVLRNCTIRGAGGPGTAYSGFNFGVLVSGQTIPSAGIVIEDCLIEQCHYGIQILKGTAGEPTDPSVTIRGCTIQNCNGNGIEMDCASQPNPDEPSRSAIGDGHLIENTQIINCENAATLGGGKIVFRNCTLLGNRGSVNVDKQDSGELPILADFDQTAIVGSENIGVRVIGGRVSMTHCIVAGCFREGLYAAADAEEAIITVDHCDFYQNLVETPELFELRLEASIALDRKLTVSNTNVIGVAGILNGTIDDPNDYEEDAAIASYCNVLTDFESYINVTVDHEASFDPLYANPQTDAALFSRAGFQLQEGSPALAAASDGGFIGSQGPIQTRLKHWMMY
ncbi:MAG: right-handed parallel beta-helix repeat-containing protein [Candidatus Hinthialibacter antarcticus]|nr:right-handed parallel beta-helix repeat-containing protein [Candidatus Hinthialibacter antarcticus]